MPCVVRSPIVDNVLRNVSSFAQCRLRLGRHNFGWLEVTQIFKDRRSFPARLKAIIAPERLEILTKDAGFVKMTQILTNGKFKNHKSYCSTDSKPARFCVKGNGLKKDLDNDAKEVNLTCRTIDDCASALGADYSCPPEKVCDGSLAGAGDLVSCASNTECVEKNIGACVDNPNLEWVFGNAKTQKTTACEENTFNFVHSYSYSPGCGSTKTVTDPNSAVYPKHLVVNDSTRAKFALPGSFKDDEFFCVWKPRVQLLDNWGWCNGVTSVTDATAKGWHNDEPEDPVAGANVCNSSANALNATPFAGYVVVKN